MALELTKIFGMDQNDMGRFKISGKMILWDKIYDRADEHGRCGSSDYI